MPVLSRYTGIRTACLAGVCHASLAAGFFAVLLALGGRLVLFVPAAGAGSRISLRHPGFMSAAGVEPIEHPVALTTGFLLGTGSDR